MKRLLFLFLGFQLLAVASLLADDAASVAGKWTAKRTSEQGQSTTQNLEIKGNKFTFEILAGQDLFLHAEGELKLETLGPFKVARFSKIRAGQSANDLQDVDDERMNIYTLDGDTWTMASNFDKDRQQKPNLDVYKRMKAAATKTGTLVIDEVEMADTPQTATWFFCFEAKAGAETRRYYVKDKGYDKNSVTIPMALELPGANSGQKCSFKMQLDDVEEDTCTDEVDNRSTGEFTVSDRGSQTFKPESNWRYTIRWHLKN
jgi:hypothetical protein